MTYNSVKKGGKPPKKTGFIQKTLIHKVYLNYMLGIKTVIKGKKPL